MAARPRSAAPSSAPSGEPPPYAGGAPSSLPRVAISLAFALGGLYFVVSAIALLTTWPLPGGLRGDASSLLKGLLLLVAGGLARARWREGLYLAALLHAASLVEIVLVHAFVGAPSTSVVGAIVLGAMVAMYVRAAGLLARPRASDRRLLAALLVAGLVPGVYEAWAVSRIVRAGRLVSEADGLGAAGNLTLAETRLRDALALAPDHEGARLRLASAAHRRCLAGGAPAPAACLEAAALLEEGERRAPGFLGAYPEAARMRDEAHARGAAGLAPK